MAISKGRERLFVDSSVVQEPRTLETSISPVLAYDLVEFLPRKKALLFFIRTPFYTAFAYQKSPNSCVSIAFDFKTHILLAHFQLGYFRQLDSVLSHTGKYNAYNAPLSARTASNSVPESVGCRTTAEPA